MYDFNVKAEALEQPQKVNDREIRIMKKKIRYNKTRFSLVLFTAILIFVIIYSLFDDKGLLPICCLGLIFIFPVTIGVLKKKEIHSCYAVVTEKKTRYAKSQGRFSPTYVSYEKTEDGENIQQNKKSFYAVYFCSVEINGRKYDDVWCYDKDFVNIGIGDKVIVSTICDESEPVIFAAE